jgi:hypothetical protein
MVVGITSVVTEGRYTLCPFFRRNVDCGGKDDTETETEEAKTDAAAAAGDKDAKNAIDGNVEGKS